jgi:hypothetical protein
VVGQNGVSQSHPRGGGENCGPVGTHARIPCSLGRAASPNRRCSV